MKQVVKKQWINGVCALGVALGAVTACQPAAPSRQLVAARRVYDQARQGAAAERDPTSVQDARASLQAAEAAHVDAPGSQRERNHAYISIRKSELAMSRARESAALAQQERVARARGALASEAEADQARAALQQRERELGVAIVALAMLQAERGAMLAREQGPVRVTGVFFATGSAELSPVARQQLDIVANELESRPERTTVIEGFADSRGRQAQNVELSERRASRVREYLASRGVDAARLEAVGLGESYPVASNTTPTGRAANRRAEISTGADPGGSSSRARPPGAEDDAAPSPGPAVEPSEPSERQPVGGEDDAFPDDPKTREPGSNEPR